MTDSSTFFVKQSKIRDLEILFKGDPILLNVYHVLAVSPEKYFEANYDLAEKFVRFMSSFFGQALFGEYGKFRYGTALYNDAEYAKKWEKRSNPINHFFTQDV